MSRPRVLLLAPWCDPSDVGEAWSTWQWAHRLSQHCDATVLALRRPGRPAPAESLPHARVVEWAAPPFPRRLERFAAMAKPAYLSFHAKARRWIEQALAAGEGFDLAHQLAPLAPRYPSPAEGTGLRLVLGPLGGALVDPPGFPSRDPWWVKLRALDALRLRHDPALVRTLRAANLVLGVAPYVREQLAHLAPKRFEVEGETGVEALPPRRLRARRPGSLRALFVGRLVRSKGAREAIGALAHVRDLPEVRLDVVGAGPEEDACRRERRARGVADRVVFHGRLPRERVEELYREADVLLFPSWREASGNVVLEAMAHGLPPVVVARGGPGHVVDETCGVTVPAEHPADLARDLGVALRRLATTPDLLARLGDGARARVAAEHLWDVKVARMLARYDALLGAREAAA